MSLTALPSELLFQVAELICRTAPKNVLDFALTSRRLRAVAGPLTEECRKLTQDYKEKDVNNFGAAEVLFEICKRPWVALHLKKLRLAAARSWRTLERPKNKKQLAVVQAFNLRRSDISDDDLEHLVLQSGLVPTQDAVVWKNAINVGDEDYLFALLLASLPNLEHLVIRLDSNKMEQVKEMVRAIKRKWPERKTLPNIKSVKVLEREGASSCDLEIFPLFAAIPGVEIIQGGNLTGMYRECYRDGWLSYPGASASITHVHLENCGMSVEGLETLMKSLHKLQSFRYIHHRAGWGLHALSTLLKNARRSLHTLQISAGSGSPRYIGPLREFTALKHVTVDTDMLIKNGKMQRFVDLMPASIEVCTIAGNSLTKHEDNFLADLYRPSFHYPNLKKIYAEDSWGRKNIGQERLKFQKEFHKQKTQTSYMARYR